MYKLFYFSKENHIRNEEYIILLAENYWLKILQKIEKRKKHFSIKCVNVNHTQFFDVKRKLTVHSQVRYY